MGVEAPDLFDAKDAISGGDTGIFGEKWGVRLRYEAQTVLVSSQFHEVVVLMVCDVDV